MHGIWGFLRGFLVAKSKAIENPLTPEVARSRIVFVVLHNDYRPKLALLPAPQEEV